MAHDRNRSGPLVIRGEAGAGKSALLRYAADRARAGDMGILSAQGVEFESDLPFAGLSALLRPLVDRIEEIPPLQASALAGALVLGRAVQDERFRVYAGTLSLLAAAAEERPLVCLVDDAHWLDAGSLEALLFVARRLEAEGIVLLLTADRNQAGEIAAAKLPEMRLGGLDRQAAAELLRLRSTTAVAGTVAERVRRHASGNPLAIVELARRLTDAQLAGKEALGDPLPTAGSFDRTVLRQIQRLPRDTQRALVVVAAAGTEMDAVSPAMRYLGIGEAALEPAESAGLVRVTHGKLHFRHPLIRSTAYHRARPAKRRAAHAALAEVLTHKPDRRAWHLAAAATGPDEEVAEALERAAGNARARSAHGSAANALERAARLTPDDRKRAERFLAGAREAKLSGRVETTIGLLEAAQPLARDPRLTADIQRLRAGVEVWRGMPLRTHKLLVEEAARIEPLDKGRAAAMLADAVMPAALAGDAAATLVAARRAADVLGEDAESAKAALGIGLMISGQTQEARRLLLEGQPLADDADSLGSHEILHLQGRCLMLLGEYAHARAILEPLVSAGREAGSPGILPVPLASLAELDFRTGRWPEAYAGAAESVRVAEEIGEGTEHCFVTLALVEAGLGDEKACREHAGHGLRLAHSHGNLAIVPCAHGALGSLELSLGEAERAVVEFERAMRIWETGAFGVRLLYGADLVEAYRNAGRRPEATREFETIKALEQCGSFATSQATVARCRALLAPDPEIDDAYGEAMRMLKDQGMPFERGRTELCYGERLRRAKRLGEAREHLELALDAFETLGATAWSERVRAELRASGAPLRPPAGAPTQQLTPRELQVALVVARGATNKEAAAALFLSPKTIDFHLSHVYRKLGVRSRVDLARVIQRRDEA